MSRFAGSTRWIQETGPRGGTGPLFSPTAPPFIQRLAGKRLERALVEDPRFPAGLDVAAGHVTEPAITAPHGLDSVDPILGLDTLRSRDA